VKVSLDTRQLVNQLNNITQYSFGFLDGIEAAKPQFMDNFGKAVVESLKNFIDSNARIDPQTLHHVYEWYQTGSPEARLFDIDYVVLSNNGLSFNYTFSQSRSYANNSTVPFYDKAQVMEKGTPVLIRPKPGGVLAFNDDGDQVFTKKPVIVANPGGSGVQGGFEKTLKVFFDSYFRQSFLMSSGILEHLGNPKMYKDNFKSGAYGGRSVGFKTGYEWLAKGGRIE
jgi:hypothetical protein